VTLDPARVFATLDRHGVDYVTIGAFAVIAHGYVRATADIDLVARQDRDNLERLAAALGELHTRLRGVDADLLAIDPTDPDTLANGASFTLDTDAGPVNYLNDVPGPATTKACGLGPWKPPRAASSSAWSASTTSSG
jgi:hypothetical protein